MRKYLAAYELALQNVLQRRSSLIMDRVGGVAVLASLYYFWLALMNGHKGFFGYSKAQMISYVLAINVLRSFVMTGRGWELVGDISGGRISSYLVRPMSYGGYSLALDMAQKTVYLGSAIFEIGIFAALVRAQFYLPRHFAAWLGFAATVILSSLLFFVMEFMVSALAFWTSESGGPLFCFELFIQFAAGAFFPLDVLPKVIRHVLYLSPFPYLVFFPINIYLERVKPGEALRVLAIQGAWLVVMLFFASRLWRRGLRSYAAEGG
ncbi:MAG TPA: ABC-2 family transporter protein [Elusimicrobiota bacterium]|nr:ABC-2 family transporter protein [Elusimicrobiota bacterium]